MAFVNKIIEAGLYTADVKKAEVRESEYAKSKYNPDGVCLTLWLDTEDDDGEPKRLFSDLSSVAKVNDFLLSINQKPVEDFQKINTKKIQGKTVMVEVDQYTSKAGKLSNIVKGFLPNEAQAITDKSGDPTF
jgi:hypothetical protein